MKSPSVLELPLPPPDKTGWPWTEESVCLPELMPDGKPWPRISVITPSYNQAIFIEETIRSVLLQGYPNYEYIVIDDSSTDNSVEVISKYLPWLNLVRRPRGGQSNAINHGFKMASGELIGWQNSDDLYGPDNFREAALHVSEHPEFQIYYGTTRGFQDCKRSEPWLFSVCEEVVLETLLDRLCMMNQSMFFRQEIFNEQHYLREDLHYVMDVEYFWRLALHGYKYRAIPAMIGYYRQHKLAKSNSNVIFGDRETYQMYRELVNCDKVETGLRKEIRRRMWQSLFSSFRKSRRNILPKLVPELILRTSSSPICK